MLSRLVLLLSLAAAVSAQSTTPVYTLRSPSVFGSGCPFGTAHAEIAGDGQSISILFSDYSVSTTADITRVRKCCNFVLPVDAVPGVSIGFYQVDFRGYAYVPQVPTAYGSLTNEYFFAGQPGPVMAKRYDAGADQPIFESTPISVQSVIWSPCGGSTNFRINSATIAYKPNAGGEDVQIQIDSVDAKVSGQVQVYVVYQQCNGSVPIQPTPAPTTAAPTPTTTKPVPTSAAPVPTTAKPASTTVAPMAKTTTPAPSIATPTPTAFAPPPTSPPPVLTTATPPATVTPVPTTTTATIAPSTVIPAPTTASTVTPAPTAAATSVPPTATPTPPSFTPTPPLPTTAIPQPLSATPESSVPAVSSSAASEPSTSSVPSITPDLSTSTATPSPPSTSSLEPFPSSTPVMSSATPAP